MSADAHANWATSVVKIPPSPADSGLTVSVKPGEGILFPEDDGFNCIVWQAGVQSTYYNSEVVRISAVPRTTIAVASNGAVLPQATIHVADESTFISGGGTAGIKLTSGAIAIIRYTGVASGQLTGCTLIGGGGTLHTSDIVVGDDFTIGSRKAENAGNGLAPGRSILVNDLIEAAITKKTLVDAEAGGGGGSYSKLSLSWAGILTPIWSGLPLLTGEGFYYAQAADDHTQIVWTSPPYLIAALGTIVDLADVSARWEALIGASPVITDYNLSAWVTDLAGTNVSGYDGTVVSDTPTAGPYSKTWDGTGKTWTTTVGTDLVGTGSILKSTAGGVYVVSLLAGVVQD